MADHGDLEVVTPDFSNCVSGKGLVAAGPPHEPTMINLYDYPGGDEKMMLMPGKKIPHSGIAVYLLAEKVLLIT